MPDYNMCNITPSDSGHVHSVDCWCEPQGYWMRDAAGDPLFVIEHNDLHDENDAEGMIHKRSTVLNMRSHDASDWVTRILDRVSFRRALPHPDDRPRLE